MKKMSQKAIVDRLIELFEEEHGDCEQSTCDMSTAYREGYALWAIQLFYDCGAASPRFDSLWDQLSKASRNKICAERKEFAKTPGFDCVHCNARVWNPEEVDYFCDSCRASDCRIKINTAGLYSHRADQGRHLINPTPDEINSAIEECIRDGFVTLWVHEGKESHLKPVYGDRECSWSSDWNARQRRACFGVIAGGAA